MTRVGSVLCIAMLAVALAACGGEDGDGTTAGSTATEPTAEDFAAEANAICVAANQRLVEVNLEVGYITNARIDQQQLEQLLPLREEALAELEALEPPADQAETWDRYLSERQDLVDATQAVADAYEADDEKGLEQAGEDVQAALTAAVKSAGELGLDDCEGVLPDDDAEAAEASLQALLDLDPDELCTTDGVVTEPFIESLGGAEECEALQEEYAMDKESADSFEVLSAEGINDAIATLDYEQTGGRFDGGRATATLYYVDGTWKIFQITAIG